jgi:retron-type reverse transcriptase
MLGIPTVTDRLIQQAIARQLTAIYDAGFNESSYGFRPKRSAHQVLEYYKSCHLMNRRLPNDTYGW